MKVLIVLCCAVAAVVAKPGYFPSIYGAPLISHQGVPLDTPEVAAAKAEHFAAHARAQAGHPGAAIAVQAAPVVLTSQGVPADTPEVAAAKAAHFAAVARAQAIVPVAPAVVGYTGYNGYHGYAGYAAAPVVLTAQGVPVDTPEVQAARAANAAAHLQAKGLILG